MNGSFEIDIIQTYLIQVTLNMRIINNNIVLNRCGGIHIMYIRKKK